MPTSYAEPTSEAVHETRAGRISADPAFLELIRRRDRLGFVVVGSIVVIYFGYILLLAFAPGLMRSHVTTTITAGFPLGLGVLVATFLLVALYVWRSRMILDRMSDEIVNRIAP